MPKQVTLVYRRGPEHMSASGYEQEFAQIKRRERSGTGRSRADFCRQNGRLSGVECEFTQLDDRAG